MFSTPVRVQKCLFISETGNRSLVSWPISRGWVYNEEAKLGWVLVNKLKVAMEGLEGEVLPISERSCLPLDPYGKLTEEERAEFAGIKDIAAEHWHDAYSRVTEEDRKSINVQMARTILWLVFITILIIVIALLWTRKG